MVPYTVRVVPAAAKQLAKLPRSIQARIVPVINALADNPRPHGSTKIVGSETTYRVRVGAYRVLYDVIDRVLVIEVVRIADRKEAY